MGNQYILLSVVIVVSVWSLWYFPFVESSRTSEADEYTGSYGSHSSDFFNNLWENINAVISKPPLPKCFNIINKYLSRVENSERLRLVEAVRKTQAALVEAELAPDLISAVSGSKESIRLDNYSRSVQNAKEAVTRTVDKLSIYDKTTDKVTKGLQQLCYQESKSSYNIASQQDSQGNETPAGVAELLSFDTWRNAAYEFELYMVIHGKVSATTIMVSLYRLMSNNDLYKTSAWEHLKQFIFSLIQRTEWHWNNANSILEKTMISMNKSNRHWNDMSTIEWRSFLKSLCECILHYISGVSFLIGFTLFLLSIGIIGAFLGPVFVFYHLVYVCIYRIWLKKIFWDGFVAQEMLAEANNIVSDSSNIISLENAMQGVSPIVLVMRAVGEAPLQALPIIMIFVVVISIFAANSTALVVLLYDITGYSWEYEEIYHLEKQKARSAKGKHDSQRGPSPKEVNKEFQMATETKSVPQFSAGNAVGNVDVSAVLKGKNAKERKKK